MNERASSGKSGREPQIIKRAYGDWEQAGSPEGRAEEFYHQAEQELQNETKVNPSQPDNLNPGDPLRSGNWNA